MPTQEIDQEWQLDRIDQRDLPLDGEFTYEADGSGVRIYIIDSGVRGTHQEFTGRIEPGYSTVGSDPHVDTQGHGTAVASAAAGSTVGVAKGATIVPVQVDSDGGSWSRSEVIEGIEWVIANHPGGPAVINFSGGGSAGLDLDDAARAAVAAGFPFTVAAMNSDSDVTGSPARVRELITVGASDPTDARAEVEASKSNFGPGVDLFAPGHNNWVAANTADDAYELREGTSHAAPLVAGVIACILQNYPDFTPKQVRDYLVWASTKGRLTDLPKFTPNRLLYSPLMVEQWLAVERAKRYRPVRRPVRSFEQQGGVWGLGNPWPTLGEPYDPPDPTPTVLEGWGVPI